MAPQRLGIRALWLSVPGNVSSTAFDRVDDSLCEHAFASVFETPDDAVSRETKIPVRAEEEGPVGSRPAPSALPVLRRGAPAYCGEDAECVSEGEAQGGRLGHAGHKVSQSPQQPRSHPGGSNTASPHLVSSVCPSFISSKECNEKLVVVKVTTSRRKQLLEKRKPFTDTCGLWHKHCCISSCLSPPLTWARVPRAGREAGPQPPCLSLRALPQHQAHRWGTRCRQASRTHRATPRLLGSPELGFLGDSCL